MPKERLDKLLTSTGRWSRSEARQIIRDGRVQVNHFPAMLPESKYDSNTIELLVDGEHIALRQYLYIMLNKPAGVLSSTEDKYSQTVLELLPNSYRHRGLFPVGRLDRDTEGLLLLTNDGALAHALLAPKKHVNKQYFVRVHGALNRDDEITFSSGMTLGDGLHCLPAKLDILSSGIESEAMVTLYEGKFHQIKRMFAACGKHVIYLRRDTMGPLKLDSSLEPGTWRELNSFEKSSLLILHSSKEN